MPTIPVNLGDVVAFESLPVGQYLAEIEKVTYREPREEGKFPQLQVLYAVIDGDHVGRKQSEFLSLSPKAAFRLKKWFNKFGLGDVDNLDVDDETNELTEPDVIGARVIFKVYEDKPKPGETEPQMRCELVSYEDDAPAASTPAPKSAATSRSTAPKSAATPTRRPLR